jgi:hypothetical protein
VVLYEEQKCKALKYSTSNFCVGLCVKYCLPERRCPDIENRMKWKCILVPRSRTLLCLQHIAIFMSALV